MFRRVVMGAAIGLAALTVACAPPPAELVPPQLLRVDASYACVDPDATTAQDPNRCVFWRTAAGQVFYGPFSVVHLPPAGSDVLIPPPVIEVP